MYTQRSQMYTQRSADVWIISNAIEYAYWHRHAKRHKVALTSKRTIYIEYEKIAMKIAMIIENDKGKEH